MLAASESAGGRLEQAEAGIGDAAEQVRANSMIQIGFDEVGETVGLPMESGEAGEIGLVLDIFGRIALAKTGEQASEDAGVFEIGDSRGWYGAWPIGVHWS